MEQYMIPYYVFLGLLTLLVFGIIKQNIQEKYRNKKDK